MSADMHLALVRAVVAPENLAVIEADVRERIALSIESAWDEQCAGHRNPDVCESCRAYGCALDIARGAS